jgi:hypothetical protein
MEIQLYKTILGLLIGCDKWILFENNISVVSYYGSIKNTIVNQWGYSYETLDTGYQYFIKSWVFEEIFYW